MLCNVVLPTRIRTAVTRSAPFPLRSPAAAIGLAATTKPIVPTATRAAAQPTAEAGPPLTTSAVTRSGPDRKNTCCTSDSRVYAARKRGAATRSATPP